MIGLQWSSNLMWLFSYADGFNPDAVIYKAERRKEKYRPLTKLAFYAMLSSQLTIFFLLNGDKRNMHWLFFLSFFLQL